MLAIKDPLILYWLHTSGILETIKNNLEERLNVDINLDMLRLRTDGEVSTLEVLTEFNKEIEEQISSFKMESVENVSEEAYSQILSTLSEKYPKDKLTIINCQLQSKQIRSLIQQAKLPNGLNEYQNYYQLQNMIYVFARWNISDDVLRTFTKTQFNDSLNEDTVYYNKPDIKIEDISLGTKIGQFDGGELWNCKYKNIPHTYVKFKDPAWEEGTKKNILHTSHPKYLPGLGLCPPMHKLKPSKDKLPQLLSFLKTLQQSYPSHYPTIDSMFQSNGKLMIFTKENNYKINKGWLCYRVVYGQISYQGYLRWVRHNPESQIAKYNSAVEQYYEFSEM